MVYFFKSVYFLALRAQCFGQLWLVLTKFSQAKIVRWCTKIDKYQVCVHVTYFTYLRYEFRILIWVFDVSFLLHNFKYLIKDQYQFNINMSLIVHVHRDYLLHNLVFPVLRIVHSQTTISIGRAERISFLYFSLMQFERAL